MGIWKAAVVLGSDRTSGLRRFVVMHVSSPLLYNNIFEVR